MRNNLSGKMFWLTMGILILVPLFSQATGIKIENPLGEGTTFSMLIYRIVDFIFNIALVFAPLMIVVAGFYFVTAAGEPARIQTAKNIIIWTLVGFIVILLSKGLIAMLREALQVQL